MKKFILVALCCMSVITVFAKSEPIDPKYGVGAVTVNSIGRVEFIEEIEIPVSADLDKCYSGLFTWAKGRFARPIVLKSDILSDNNENRRFTMRVQQNLVFKNSALVTDMAKISYNLNFAIKEANGKKSCVVTMTDISYLYEEDREEGGFSFAAEDWITDDEAFNKNKTKFLRTTGKFRIKTIDLYNEIVDQTIEIIKAL